MNDVGARWRRVYSLEWHASEFLALSDAERIVYFYAKTGPQSASVGIFRISSAVAVEDIGNLTAVEFDYRLDRVCVAFGCGAPFVPSRPNQRACRPSCRLASLSDSTLRRAFLVLFGLTDDDPD